ncbi:STAS domain-containing protein [Telmatospirillum sp. J64-1]|uniref:STAS domain-containing protein n=1 Tax=Telmatospirillum sp. J64-1 TaxID=2502183 RepID=UPI00115EE691|nr:STAS domain-containing protein [Telmatospirillum sp. J64-1]
MTESSLTRIPELLRQQQQALLTDWLDRQMSSSTLRPDLIREQDLREQSRRFLSLLAEAVAHGLGDHIQGDGYRAVSEFLGELSRSRANQGFSPTETATFVFSFKETLFNHLRDAWQNDGEGLADDIWRASTLIDRLGLHTVEVYQKGREAIIQRQQQEMMELSTPVVELWGGIVALPLIGTLDSARTQVVMENLLERIVESNASIAIIDITGVPTVDTLVAQHLLKTVAAARLMGAECIISGIRPQIAQTIVHLGVDLNEVLTKATLASAFQIALKRLGGAILTPDSQRN